MDILKIYLRDRTVEKEDSPFIMGVLNLTPDSFSDGGRHIKPGTTYFDMDSILRQTEQMIKDGADIIDIGGESTRPGAEKVNADTESERVLDVIKKIKAEFDIIVSIDTYKEAVARRSIIEGGADIINDISALAFSEHMANTAAEFDVPVVLMHIKGTPENMQHNPSYTNVTEDIKDYFSERIEYALSKGIKKEKLILDPGIGFGKTTEHNITIIRSLSEFEIFDLPLLMGLSRKRFLGEITGETDPLKRDTETICADIAAMTGGASILRVHDVKNTVKSVKIFNALIK